jgi:mRNA interferase MazF
MAGLPAPSIIRTAKMATIEAADATKVGRIGAALLKQSLRRVGQELGFDA